MASRTSRRERCVCNACRRKGFHGRFTLRRKLNEYKREPKCPSCGSTEIVSVEARRQREMAKRKDKGNFCRCNPIPFPHEKGSILGCVDHPKGIESWTDEDYYQYRGCLATARGDEF